MCELLHTQRLLVHSEDGSRSNSDPGRRRKFDPSVSSDRRYWGAAGLGVSRRRLSAVPSPSVNQSSRVVSQDGLGTTVRTARHGQGPDLEAVAHYRGGRCLISCIHPTDGLHVRVVGPSSAVRRPGVAPGWARAGLGTRETDPGRVTGELVRNHPTAVNNSFTLNASLWLPAQWATGIT